MTEQLRYLLKYLANFDEPELDKICLHFKHKFVKKNTILLSEGQVCKEFYYIKTGCIRTYFITQQGHEKIGLINLDCSIGTAFTSFVTQTPSLESIDALEDTELFAISHTNFYQLNKELNHWRDFYQKSLEMAFVYQNRYIESLVTMTAKQRYEQLLQNNPKMIQRLPNKILASYLDVTQETLSRLKSK